MTWKFADRFEAGRMLAHALNAYAEKRDAVILALPRGGVPVGYEVSMELKVPLDVFVVRKIGVPFHPELAMGALASDGTYAVERETVSRLGIRSDQFLSVFQNELREARRREREYRRGRPSPDLRGKIAILVDDGLATGSTMRVAVDAARRRGAARVVVAVPVASREAGAALSEAADEVVCLFSPQPFFAVGLYYENFAQITDAQVCDLLSKSAAGGHAA